MPLATDIRVKGVALYLIPVETRVPLKFGTETLTSVTCARAAIRVETADGRSAVGWGETPLSVQWVWPENLPYAQRHTAMKEFCNMLAHAWAEFGVQGHAIEVGHAFIEGRLEELLAAFNAKEHKKSPMPWLAALVCCAPFDLALHDAFGQMHNLPTYESYNASYMNYDLSAYLEDLDEKSRRFRGHYPEQHLQFPRPDTLPVWHLVGGKDWIDEEDRDGALPNDGYPVFLRDWIRRDGLKCLKVKLRGNDADWDYARLLRVGKTAEAEDVHWLSTDFNCTVTDPAYVNEILDRLLWDEPGIYGRILYVEQPFPYDIEANPIDVHSVSARKPLFMDESAHDWKLVRQGRSLGWTGVALKTCKTQTGALLSQAWARVHGMTLMVQDLTNPMLAQIPHVLLGAHAGTIMGVESNAMQFYPEASRPEAKVHPGLYTRQQGMLRLDTLQGPGFGYNLTAIDRELPESVVAYNI